MNKKQIRLTESDLKQIVKESVNKILKESEGLNATPYLNTNEFDRGFNLSQDKNDEINASWEAIDQEYGTPDIDFNDPYCSDANKLVYRDNGMTNGIYPLDDLSNPNVIDDDNYRSFWSYNDKISPEYFRKNESKNMNKKLIRLTESDLHRIVKESVNRVIREATIDTQYGGISTNPLKPTFDDVETQNRLKNDTIEMLANLDEKRFMRFWNNRMKYDDPDTVDAIYREYYKRHQNGQLGF